MNKTPNYQLNQWAKSDRVLMDDFNADNAKIDAALKANASAISSEVSARKSAVAALEGRSTMHLLASAAAEGGSHRFTVLIGNIDWNQYRMVVVTARIHMADSAVFRIATHGNGFNTQIGAGSTWAQIILFPTYNANAPTCGIIIDNSPKAFNAGGLYSQLDGFEFYNVDSQVLPTSTASVYGIK